MTTDDYPRYTDREFAQRYAAVRQVMADTHLDALLVYGSGRSAAEIQYLTNWIVQREGFLVLPRQGEPSLFVQFFNHVPNARRISILDRTEWAGADSIATVADELRRVDAGSGRIGLVGGLGYREYARLSAALPHAAIVDATPEILRLRLVKSEEEVEWLRRGAQVSDRAIQALVEQVRPGLRDTDLGGIVEAAHHAAGGSSQIHFMATTPMANPSVCVPAQHLSQRIIEPGDALVVEISGQYWGHSGQVLRTFSIGADPTPTYQRLHEVALEAFQRICDAIRAGATTEAVLDAADVIAENGFSVCDDLVHGYGGGYLPPILRTRQTWHGAMKPFTFQENMFVVVQPNVITPDERAGVQVGEMVRVTKTGVERMHAAPLALLRCA